MSITATKGMRNQERATAHCEERGCLETASVPASHTHSGGFARGGSPVLKLLNEGQAYKKFEKEGWARVNGTLRCPKCEADRKSKAQKEPVVIEAVKAPPRAPTPEQEVDIIVALSSAYDRKAKRYNGNETDRTIADLVGDGCMPGWVAQIRQDKFGPAGNEEADAIRADIAKAKEETRRLIETFAAEQQKKLDAIASRLDALYRAEDKRVRA